MKTEIITDINQAETLWKKLSPKEYMYDLWPFRFAFYKHNPHPLNFITIYDGKNRVAMLPLQKNSETNELEFFGVYADFNRAFIKPGYEHLLTELYAKIERPANLEYIHKQDVYNANFKVQELGYYLPLHDIASSTDYIEKYWEGRARRKFKNEMRRLEKDFKIELVVDKPEYVEKMFKFNIQNFGEESGFLSHKERMPAFRELLHNGLESYVLALLLNGKVESTGMVVIYNDFLYDLNSGTNRKIPNLGKMMVLKKIDFGISKGVKFYDASTYEGNWKERFNLKTVPRYIYKLT